MTNEQIAEIRKYCEAATPGPWDSGIAGNANVVHFDGDDISGIAIAFWGPNRAFVARARTDLPFALTALEEARRRVGELEVSEKQWEEIFEDHVRTIKSLHQRSDADTRVIYALEVRLVAREERIAELEKQAIAAIDAARKEPKSA